MMANWYIIGIIVIILIMMMMNRNNVEGFGYQARLRYYPDDRDMRDHLHFDHTWDHKVLYPLRGGVKPFTDSHGRRDFDRGDSHDKKFRLGEHSIKYRYGDPPLCKQLCAHGNINRVRELECDCGWNVSRLGLHWLID